MNSQQLQKDLIQWTVDNSGYEDRTYLGMSHIHECPRRLYCSLTTGDRPWDTNAHLTCYLGYLFERDIKTRLAGLNLYTPGTERELIAPWDPRYRGHTDGEIAGDLLEIKSTTHDKISQISRDTRLPPAHWSQIQTYMHYGGYKWAKVVYVARDTGYIWVAENLYHRPTAERLEAKARAILHAVDTHQPPPCECGHCKE